MIGMLYIDAVGYGLQDVPSMTDVYVIESVG